MEEAQDARRGALRLYLVDQWHHRHHDRADVHRSRSNAVAANARPDAQPRKTTTSAALRDGRPRSPADRPRAARAAAYDADGSGKIGASELFSAMTKLGRWSRSRRCSGATDVARSPSRAQNPHPTFPVQVQQMLGCGHDGDDELNLHEFKTPAEAAATDEVWIQVRRGGTCHRALRRARRSIGDLGADASGGGRAVRLEARGEHMLRYDALLLIAPAVDADGR